MRVKTISPARNEPSSSRCLRMGSVDSRPAEVIGAAFVFIGALTSGYSWRPAASQTVPVYATRTDGVACKYSSGIAYRYPFGEPSASPSTGRRRGPDHEVIEIWTASKNHRFEHVHLLASNLNSTLGWFHDHRGLAPPWWPVEVGATFPVTDGTVIDHIAFSFAAIKPVFRRMQRAAMTIVRPIEKSREYGLTSFFVRGPDGLLVEIVEEAPIPEGVWQGKP